MAHLGAGHKSAGPSPSRLDSGRDPWRALVYTRLRAALCRAAEENAMAQLPPVAERFLRYVRFDTQSAEEVEGLSQHPRAEGAGRGRWSTSCTLGSPTRPWTSTAT